MGFHVKASIGEGFGVKTPELNIRVMLKYIVHNNDGENCRVEVRGSPLIQEGELNGLSIDSSLIVAPDITIKINRIGYNSRRVKFYVDKPGEYKVYQIKR